MKLNEKRLKLLRLHRGRLNATSQTCDSTIPKSSSSSLKISPPISSPPLPELLEPIKRFKPSDESESKLPWKLVKLSDDFIFHQSGFLQLEELQFDPHSDPRLQLDLQDDALVPLNVLEGSNNIESNLSENELKSIQNQNEQKSIPINTDPIPVDLKLMYKNTSRFKVPFYPESWIINPVPDLPEWTQIYPLHARLLFALSDMKFTSPSPIQKCVIPQALISRHDIIGSSQTGSGKTLAFGLPILQQILESKERQFGGPPESQHLKGLILTPSRELAIQIVRHLNQLSAWTDIDIIALIGGMAIIKQERVLSHHPDLIVATPGRLWDWMERGFLNIEAGSDSFFNFQKLSFFVIDEADKMVELGQFEQMSKILQFLRHPDEKFSLKITNQEKIKRQTFIFSATLSFRNSIVNDREEILKPSDRPRRDKGDIERVAIEEYEKLLDFERKVKVIDLNYQDWHVDSLYESKVFCLFDEKDYYLYYFVEKYEGRTIVFVNTISVIKRLTSILQSLNIPACKIHANMAQKERLKNLERFNASEKMVIISTDVLSRGLDIVDIDHVIHYQVPLSADIYIHRSGRTARAQKNGISITFVEPKERKKFQKILYDLKRSWPADFPVDLSLMDEIKIRVDLSKKLTSYIQNNEKEKKSTGWVKNLAKRLEVDLPEEYDRSDRADSCRDGMKKVGHSRRDIEEMAWITKKLNQLLEKPLLPVSVSTKFITNEQSASKWLKKKDDQVSSVDGHSRGKMAIEDLHSNQKPQQSLEMLKDIQDKKRLMKAPLANAHGPRYTKDKEKRENIHVGHGEKLS